jgi:hypothetical protein
MIRVTVELLDGGCEDAKTTLNVIEIANRGNRMGKASRDYDYRIKNVERGLWSQWWIVRRHRVDAGALPLIQMVLEDYNHPCGGLELSDYVSPEEPATRTGWDFERDQQMQDPEFAAAYRQETRSLMAIEDALDAKAVRETLADPDNIPTPWEALVIRVSRRS